MVLESPSNDIYLSLHFCKYQKNKKQTKKLPLNNKVIIHIQQTLSTCSFPSSRHLHHLLQPTAAGSISLTAITLPWMNNDAECIGQGQVLGQDHKSNLVSPCGCATLSMQKAS